MRKRPASPLSASRAVRLVGLLGIIGSLPLGARADTYTWTGGTGSNPGGAYVWNDPNNWSGGVVPPTSGLTTSDLVFGNSPSVFPFLDTAYSAHSLTFAKNSAGGSYIFEGDSLTLGAGGLTQADNSARQLFDATTVSLGANQTWSLGNGAGSLTFNQGLDIGGYTLVFTGGSNTINGTISGTGNVRQGGANTLTLTGNNTYTGRTALANGKLNLGSAGALGTSGPLVFIGGILQYSANNTTDYSARFSQVAGQNYQIDTNGQNVTFANRFNGTTTTLTKFGAGTLTLTADQNDDVLTLNVVSGTLAITAGATGATPATNGEAGGPAILTVSGSTLTPGSPTPMVSLSGGTLLMDEILLGTKPENAGNYQGGSGSMSQTGGTLNVPLLLVGHYSYGNFTLADGTLNAKSMNVGDFGGIGVVAQTGGTAIIQGPLYMNGGENTNLSLSSYTLSGGSLQCSLLQLGFRAAGVLFTQTGGMMSTSAVVFGSTSQMQAQGSGTYTLHGGISTTNSVSQVQNIGKGFFRFAGGTLQAGQDNAAFFQGLTTADVLGDANTPNSGAVIDTQTYSVTVAQNLVHSTTKDDPALDGGLTKLGSGTLSMAGTNTYTGPTKVKAGTLVVSGSLGTSNVPVTVASGATLAVNGSVTASQLYNNGGRVRLEGTLILPAGGTFTNNGTLDLINYSGTLPTGFSNGNTGKVVRASDVRIAQVTRSPGSVQLTVTAYAGHTYQLQASTALGSTANWTNVGSSQVPTADASLLFSDAPASTDAQRFYRVLISP